MTEEIKPEPEEEEQPEIESEVEKLSTEEQTTSEPTSEPTSVSTFDTNTKIREDENLIKPTLLNRQESLERHFIAKGSGAEDIALQGASVVKNSIPSSWLKHVPGVGLVASLFSRKNIQEEVKEISEQFSAINKVRMRILVGGPRAVVDTQRGVSPVDYINAHMQLGPDAVLANTLEYTQLQLKKRFDKLEKLGFATDIQTIGVAVSTTGIGAPVGLAIGAVGTAGQAALSAKSAMTFFRKLKNGTLGAERAEHASVLFGLALEYLGVAPSDLVSKIGTPQSRVEASKKAYEILKTLGMAPDRKDPEAIKKFQTEGHLRIFQMLKG